MTSMWGGTNTGNPSSLPSASGASNASTTPVATNYGSIFGYSAEDSQRNVEYYDQSTLGPVAGPTIKTKTQKTGTYDQVFGNYRNMQATDPKAFVAMQQRLAAAGFYDPYLKKGEAPKLGAFDPDTTKALNDAMGEAVLEGRPVDDVLDERSGSGQAGAGASVPQVTKTNPEQLKAAIQAVAPNLIGERAPQDVVDKIVSTYQDLENKQNTQTQAGADTIDAAPSGSAWFQEQLQQLMPNTTKSYQIFQGLSAMQNNIGAPVTQLYHG